MRDQYNFNISLSILNHLGRNLYRNVITVIGEAISNAWDADANNVWITIDRENNSMSIVDDGIGMSDDDFQGKFLKIGYSKRKNKNYKSKKGRMFIGRKGIGKLALLSCSKRMHIISKDCDGSFVGGIIDNSSLDQAIGDDVNSQDYTLEPIEAEKCRYIGELKSGTLLFFEDISSGITNTIDYIKKAIALSFRFSLYDSDFNIFVNNDIITQEILSDFANNTQFLWVINDASDPYLAMLDNVKEREKLTSDFNISGYIASTVKPSQLKIRGAQEKMSIDLFVNGRLREKDILRHIPSSRIVENYVYGQIHFDELDCGDSVDVFTSNRESVISDDPLFVDFLAEVDNLFKRIIEQWDEFRRKHGDDGDPQNTTRINPTERKALELFNASLKTFADASKKSGIKKEKNEEKSLSSDDLKVDEWIKILSEESRFNIPSYTDCFISENLLRKYIEEMNIELSEEAKKEAEDWKDREKKSKNKANINYDIRISTDDLYYLDMDHLANLVDKPANKDKDPGIARSAVVYKPLRNAVGHTSIITDNAKQQLSLELENIKARLGTIMRDLLKNQ